MTGIKSPLDLARLVVFIVAALTTAVACNDATAPVSANHGPSAGGPRLTIVPTATPPVAAGFFHTCALKADGTVVCWGETAGQFTVPDDLADVVQIGAGDFHTCAVKSDGTLVCWGNNNYGQAPRSGTLSGVVQMAGGGSDTCVVRSAGTVSCWGYNAAGETSVPDGLTDVTEVAAGEIHTCALKSNGTVVCWGWDSDGQTTVPDGLSDVIQIAAGEYHTCAVKSDGTVVCWGNDLGGQSTVPVGLSGVIQLTAGDYHTCAAKSDGSVVCWGINYSGQTAVPHGLSGVTRLAGGGGHTCAVKSNGEVVCWGDNAYGAASVPAGLNLYARVLPVATFSAPLAVEPGSPIVMSFSDAHVPGHPAVTAFTYAFSCGDGTDFSAFSSTRHASCPTTVTETLRVHGKVRDSDGDTQSYSTTVQVRPFSSACTFTRITDTQAQITVSWAYANPGATKITFRSGSHSAVKTRAPELRGTARTTLRWTPSVAPPTYGLKGGAAENVASTTLVVAGTACTEQP